MDDSTLASIIEIEERRALGFNTGDLSNERTKALEYYLGRPFGNEVEGRSQVVSTDVYDVVEGMLPSLVDIFTSTNTAVQFDPQGIEDEKQARQATEACNHVFYKQNNGALILYTWFKDALIQKNGIVKWYYEDKSETRKERYEGLTDAEYQKLMMSDVEEVSHETYPDEQAQQMLQQQMAQMNPAMQMTLMGGQIPQPMLHDVEVKVMIDRGKVCVVPVPPEEFVVSPRHNSVDLDDCEFCEHRTRKTVSDLKLMGFTEDDLEGIGTEDDMKFSEEYIARRSLFEEKDYMDNESADPALREVWVAEGYIRVDYDGDGIAELRRFLKAGRKILEHDEADEICFAALTPVIMPHRFFGRSMADVCADIQLTKSVLWRQMLDNLYLTNNPRHAVLEHQANINDLITSRPGGVVRERVPNAVRPLETPFVAGASFPMVEYLDSVKEDRSGWTRYNQGTDADSLNKTATGITQIMQAGQQRIKLIARMFAETGIKRLFRGIKHTLYKSGLKQLSIRLNNSYVEVDPREWGTQWDMSVNVGLGTGDKRQQLGHLQMILQTQMGLAQMGKGYMISDSNLYETISKIVENAGFKHIEQFLTDPESVPPQAKQSPPNPEMIKMQMEAQLDQAKLQSGEKQKQMDIMADQQRAKMESETAIATTQIQAQTQLAIAQINQAAEKEKEQMKLRAQAELTVFDAQNQAGLKEMELNSQAGLKQLEVQSKENQVKMNKEPDLDTNKVFQEIDAKTTQQAERMEEGVKMVGEIASELQDAVKAVTQAAIAISQAASKMSMKKRIVRDKDGRAVGVEPVH
jgi:hypothetical protein